MSSKIRVGILGAARIAPSALLEPARDRNDIEVVSVAARDPLRARAFADEHGLQSWSESYGALVERKDLDLIYIALPPHLHRDWSVRALETGKPVLCEKPFALTAADAEAMVVAARGGSGVLIEAFHYRFHRLMHEAVALVGGGAIGTPQLARAQVHYPIPTAEGEPRWSRTLGGGALMDLGCYGLHALRTLLGAEPEVLSAESRWERGVDAATQARLRFPDGLEAELGTSMDPSIPFTEILIEGSRGRLQLNGFVLPQRAGRLCLTV